MTDEKQAIRRLLRAQRRALSAATVEHAGRAVAARLSGFSCYVDAVSVVAYVAQENEIPTGQLLDEVSRSTRPLYLPRWRNGSELVPWRLGERLEVGRGGIVEPVGPPADPPAPVVVLVPLVAFDQTGTRLGRGAGFYDRLFARWSPEVTRLGLAYEFQEHPGLPRDWWDVSMHYVITERRIVPCGVGLMGGSSLQKGGVQYR